MGRLACSFAVVLVVGAGAHADPGSEAAAKMERGLRRYNTQDYDGAIAEWREAYVLVSSPDTLFAIGQAQRLKGDCTAALLTYRAVLQAVISAAQTEEVNRVIAVCEKQLKDHPVDPPKPARPEPLVTPAPGAASSSPPSSSSPSPIARVEHRSWFRDPIALTLIVAGVAGTATGGTFLVLARSAQADAEDAPTYRAFDDAANRADRHRLFGTIGLAIGGACLIGGVIRIVTRSDTVEVRGDVAANGASLAIARRF